MGILERSKVRLSVALDRNTYQPGEDITGTVHLDVKEAISFCALRLRIKGRETIEVFIQRGTATMAVTDEIDYVNAWMTFTGPCKRSQSRERQTYEAGCYIFPFRMPLSPRLPPSFAVTTNSGHVVLQYVAAVVLDIPNGFDATDEVVFRVLSAAPLYQFTVRAAAEAALPVTRVAHVYKHKWPGCLWGKRKDAAVHVAASITPGIIARCRAGAREPAAAGAVAWQPLARAEQQRARSSSPAVAAREAEGSTERMQRRNARQQGQQQRATEEVELLACEVTVKIFNDSDGPLPALQVKLLNMVRVQYDMHESYHTSVVAKAKVSRLGLAPREERTVTVPLPLKLKDFRVTRSDSIRLPVPSLVTSVVTSAYALCVSFPGSKAERKLSFLGLVDVVDTVSVVAGSLPVPSYFAPLAGLGTEVRYVAHPTLVAFPPDEEQVFPAAHEPYLPRRADPDRESTTSSAARLCIGGSNSDAPPHADEEGADASTLPARRQAEPVPLVPVLATPMPGQIVQGCMSQAPQVPPCRGH